MTYRFNPAPFQLQAKWGTGGNGWITLYEGGDENRWIEKACFWAERCPIRLQSWDNLPWREQMAIKWKDLEHYIRRGAPRVWPLQTWTPWTSFGLTEGRGEIDIPALELLGMFWRDDSDPVSVRTGHRVSNQQRRGP